MHPLHNPEIALGWRVTLAIALGIVGGFIGGGTLGIAMGAVYIEIFSASCADYCRALLFFAFMPIGAIMGALVLSIWAGVAVWRKRNKSLTISA